MGGRCWKIFQSNMFTLAEKIFQIYTNTPQVHTWVYKKAFYLFPNNQKRRVHPKLYGTPASEQHSFIAAGNKSQSWVFNKTLSRTHCFWMSCILHRMCPLSFYRLLTWKASVVYLITKMCGCPLQHRFAVQTLRGSPVFALSSSATSKRNISHLVHKSLEGAVQSYCHLSC